MADLLKSGMLLLMVFLFTGVCSGQPAYEPTAASLAQHTAAPEWFQDAKLGIYFHWGVYSIPAYGSEWYPRMMHYPQGEERYRHVYEHHRDAWGEPTEFEYADFVPMFKAEYFDADAWALLFKKAGAKFAGPVAEHHDGFAMWDSEVTPWNAMDMGPKRDITGELAQAIRKQDMKLITTFHHARNSLWEIKPGRWTGHYDGIKKYFPSLLDDPKRAILYGYMPREQFVRMWYDKLAEVIDKYEPDIIWFDSWLDEIPEATRYQFAAYYLNAAEKRGQEVVIVRKQKDLPLEFSVNDHEKSRESKAAEQVWMTDDTISTGSWCYTQNLTIKPAADVICALIDTVSKNGVVLLNLSPLANGTIPKDQRHVLLELGGWLDRHGEAIYATRPWPVTFGEGPTKEPEGGFGAARQFLNLKYSDRDIRYTAGKDGKTVYAIQMGLPEEAITLTSVNVSKEGTITRVGSDTPISYQIHDDGTVTIDPPAADEKEHLSSYANVYKITGMKNTQ